MRRSLWTTLLILFIYLSSYAGVQHSIDELATISLTESMLHGSLQVNRMEWEQQRQPPQNAYSADGNLYSKKGPAASLLTLPFLLLGKQWTTIGAVQFTFLSTALLTALTLFTFYQLAVHLGYSDRIAMLGTVALGLGTLLWPYAKMLFSEPIAAFGVCLALLGLVKFCTEAHPQTLFFCSVGLAVLTLARAANAVLVIPFAIVVAWQLLASFLRKHDRQALLRAGLAFSLPLGAAILGTCLYNYVRFGTYLSFPRVPGEGFTTPLSVGVPGLLWSSGRGLLFYVPLTWMVGLSYAVQRQKALKPTFLTALGVILISLLFYGSWYDWPGGKAWGPRFLVPTMPAIAMLCLPAIDWLGNTAAGRWRHWLLAGWLALSVLAQLPAILINFEYQETLDAVPFEDLLWNWQASPLLTYWDKVFTGSEDPVWFHPFFWSNPTWLLGLLGAIYATLVLLHLRQGLQLRRDPHRQPPLSSLLAICLLTIILGVSLVVASRSDPRWWERTENVTTNHEVRTWIAERAAPGDLVLLDLQSSYDRAGRVWEWLNFAPLHPDYIGWQRKPHLTETNEEQLRQWLAAYGRVWLSLQATAENDPASTTEHWLKQWAYQGQSQWIGTQRIVEYILPADEGELVATGSATWQAGNGVQINYTVRRMYGPHHIAVDLRWDQHTAEPLHFSVQALNSQAQVLRQVDRPLSAEGDRHERLGMYLSEANLQLILKIYDPASGTTYPVPWGNGERADFWTLAEFP